MEKGASSTGPQRAARWLAGAVAALVFVLAHAAPDPTPETARFRHLDDSDGLSQMSALAIAQDRQGFLWIGTQVGLNRYDGAKFRTFTRQGSSPESLSEHDVTALLNDPDGTLWVGTLDGLHRFDPQTERVVPFSPHVGDGQRLPHLKINALMFDEAGALWIASDGGLSRWSAAGAALDSFGTGLRDRRVQALAPDGAKLWVGTAAGLFRFAPSDGAFAPVAADGVHAEALRRSIHALRVDHAGDLWIGTKDAGLLRLSRDGVLAQWRHDPADDASLSHDRVYALLEDREQRLWIGTEAGADLMVERDATPRFVRFQHRARLPNSIGAGRVVSLIEDAAGDLWFGTWSGGASLLSPVRSRFLSFAADSADPNAPDAAEVVHMTDAGDDRIWLGTRRGLFLFDAARYVLEPIRATTGLRVYAVAVDGESQLLGTDHGVLRHHPRDGSVVRASVPAQVGTPFVDFIVIDDTRVWIATRDADLFVLDRGLTKLLAHHVMESRAHFMTAFDESAKLLGGDKGLYWFSRDGLRMLGRVRARPDDPLGLKSDTCHYFVHARDGRMWLATAAGLHRMELSDPNDPSSARFTVFRRGGGANTNALKSVLEDANGHLWVSSNAGIARFDPATSRFTSYGAAEGAIDRGYYAFVHATTSAGHFAFGGASGFTVFDPAQIADLPPPPQPLLTELELDNRLLEVGARDGVLARPLSLSQRVVLPAGRARTVALSFASPYFVAPEQLRYAYRLDGFDEEWIEGNSRRRVATYTNLAPGEYLFRVRARTSDAEWSGAETRLSLVIEPYWWQTGWARLAAALALALAIAAAFRWRLRRHAQQQRLLEKQVVERTAGLQRAHAQLEQAYARIEQLSRTDPLTGLGNRRSLDQRLPAMLAAARAGGPRLAFLVLDVDRFKSINDGWGHTAGDQVLASLGELLQAEVAAPAFVVRWGGEEFLAVAPVADDHDALRLAERIRAAVASHALGNGTPAHLRTTVSIGFACFPFDSSAPQRLDWERVVEVADTALYAAKHAGRNRVLGYRAIAPVDADFETRLRAAPDELCRAGRLQALDASALTARGTVPVG